jgi:hypothetical protein
MTLKEGEIILEAESILDSLLATVPFVDGLEIKQKVALNNGKVADFVAIMYVENDAIRLVCEVKSNLQPRFVFDAIRKVKEYCSALIDEPAYPVVVSEYISPRSAEILNDRQVSYFDLAGNCRLGFANIYIEREGKKPKGAAKRGTKSLFGLKSSRMLRLMLNDYLRPWQVKQLAERTELSLGQVSNIRRALMDQHYAIESDEGGICINQPGALLDEWRRLYKKNIVDHSSSFYSLLNYEERITAIKSAMVEADTKNARIMLSGLSAARFQAPFAKSMSETFYADRGGVEILKKHLLLESATVGPNIIIEEPKDPFVFEEAIECAPGIKCTSTIQTYLDLYIAGEREKEAAEHLETSLLREKWNKNFKDET